MLTLQAFSKRIWTFFSRLSIQKCVLITFVTLVFFPTIIYFLFQIYSFSGQATSRVMSEKKNLVEQSNVNITLQINNLRDMTMMVYHNYQIRSFIDNYDSSNIEENSNSQMPEYLSSVVNSDKYLDSAAFTTEDGVITKGNSYLELDAYFLKHSDDVFGQKGKPVWIPTTEMTTTYGKKANVWVLARAINSITEPIGILWLFITDDFFDSVFTHEQVTANSVINIITPDGLIISSSNKDKLNTYSGLSADLLKEAAGNENLTYLNLDEEQSSQEKYLVSFSTIPKTGWIIVSLTPQREVLESVEKSKQGAYLLLLMYLLFVFVTITILSKKVFTPLSQLKRGMVTVSKGDFNHHIHKRYDDEIGLLVDNYNYMLDEIDLLMNSVIKEERAKNSERMKVLSMQINPHFIFNTLNTIKWLAAINKQANIKKMTESFITLLMSVTYNTSDAIPLEEEVILLECYAYIQKSKYMNFSITYDIAEDTQKCLVNKLILQPFVENSILHGFSQKNDKSLIRISSRLSENPSHQLIISIEDNGSGFDTESQDYITKNKSATTGEHIGISNVIERIHLYYGDTYGVQIESQPGQGTSVTINLPVILVALED